MTLNFPTASDSQPLGFQAGTNQHTQPLSRTNYTVSVSVPAVSSPLDSPVTQLFWHAAMLLKDILLFLFCFVLFNAHSTDLNFW